jgi:hypothetical protein
VSFLDFAGHIYLAKESRSLKDYLVKPKAYTSLQLKVAFYLMKRLEPKGETDSLSMFNFLRVDNVTDGLVRVVCMKRR